MNSTEPESSLAPISQNVVKVPTNQVNKVISKSKGLLSFLFTLCCSDKVTNLATRFSYLLFQLIGISFLYRTFSYLLVFVTQRFLNQSKLSIKSILISNCQEENLTMHVNMCLKDTGPVPVTVVFDSPIQLGFNYNPLILLPLSEKKASLKDSPTQECPKLNIPGIEKLKKGTNYFGTAKMPNLSLSPSISNHLGVELNVSLDTEIFSSFSALLIESDELYLQMTGSVTVLAFGFLPIHKLKLDKSCSLKGMNGLQDLHIKNLNVTGGTPEHLNLSIECDMLNPSDIDIDLGDVNLNMFYKGYHAGTVTIPSFKMSSGNNVLSTKGLFKPDRQSKVAFNTCTNLLNTYLIGKSSSVVIKGDNPEANKILYWKNALSCLMIQTELSGIKEKLIVQSSLVLSPLQLLSKVMGSNAPTRLKLFNPFDVDITITQIEAIATMRGTEIGRILENSLKKPIVMEPHVVTLSPQMDLSLEVGRAALSSLFSSLATQELFFNCKSKITCLVGGYPITLDYSQQDIPLILGST